MKNILVYDKDIEQEIGYGFYKNPSPPATISFATDSTIYNQLSDRIYDLVILDKEALGERLEKVIDTVKQGCPKTVIFVTTSRGSVESFIQAINSGAYDYFHKPFDPVVFKMAVSEALSI